MLSTQELVPESVHDGIFTLSGSSDPQYSSWVMVEFPEELLLGSWELPENNPCLNTCENEVFETLRRVDEPTPTVSLPEELIPPFSPVSNFIDQVNDDGSGNVELAAQHKLEKMLLDCKQQLNPHSIIAAQLWFPTKIVKANVLRCSQRNIIGSWSESEQFMLGVVEEYLCQSLTRVYSCDGKSKSRSSYNFIDNLVPYLSTTEEVTYLLNRQVSVSAFRQKCPQWAPNLHVYKSHVHNDPTPSTCKKNYIIYGTLAIPVFDPYTNVCVGVYEVVIASTEVDCAVLDIICGLLKAVNLRADTQFHYQPRQRVQAEILKLITKVCEEHHLPLAHTWMPCQCPDSNCKPQQLCMSNAELPFYMRDSSYYPFWEGSTMFHMTKGRAVAGTTFSSKGLCFCRDITLFPEQFSLVLLSRRFELSCSLAVCLGSAHANNDVYVVQFFWPRSLRCTLQGDDELALDITTTITQHSDMLRMVSPVYEVLEAETERISYRTELIGSQGDEDECRFSSNIMTEEEHNKASIILPQEVLPSLPSDEHKDIDHGIEVVECKVKKKTRKKKRIISKEDLLPYLNGTLREAASDLGISKSTLKRKCKELEIENWQDERKKIGIGVPARRKRSAKRSLIKEFDTTKAEL